MGIVNKLFFQAANLTLKLQRVEDRKLAKEVLISFTFTTLTKKDYQPYLQNIEGRKIVVEDRL